MCVRAKKRSGGIFLKHRASTDTVHISAKEGAKYDYEKVSIIDRLAVHIRSEKSKNMLKIIYIERGDHHRSNVVCMRINDAMNQFISFCSLSTNIIAFNVCLFMFSMV